MIQPRKDGGGKDGKISCIENDNCSTKNLFQQRAERLMMVRRMRDRGRERFPSCPCTLGFYYIFLCADTSFLTSLATGYDNNVITCLIKSVFCLTVPLINRIIL